MILPDANLILYAYDLDSPFHGVAADWWTKCLSNTAETDFQRFPGVAWFNPITGAKS